MRRILIITAALTAMCCAVWIIVLEIMRWDVPMTKLQEALYMWKPITGIIISVLIVNIAAVWRRN